MAVICSLGSNHPMVQDLQSAGPGHFLFSAAKTGNNAEAIDTLFCFNTSATKYSILCFVWTELCELNSVLLYYFSFELYVLISSSITHMGKNRSQSLTFVLKWMGVKKHVLKKMYSMQGWLIQTYFICKLLKHYLHNHLPSQSWTLASKQDIL